MTVITKIIAASLFYFVLFVMGTSLKAQTNALGIFDGQTDLGAISKSGTAFYNAGSEEYELSNSQPSLESKEPPIHFMWKRMKGDFILYSQVYFATDPDTNKGLLGCMVITNLDTKSDNVSVRIKKNGQASVRFVKNQMDTITPITQSPKNADVIQLERKGKKIIVRVAKFGEPFVTMTIDNILTVEEVYVGLFTCTEETGQVVKCVGRNVRLTIPVPETLPIFTTETASNLEVLDVETGKRSILYKDSFTIRSPIWKKDGKTIIYGKDGLLYTFDLEEKKPELLYTGDIPNNGNDHPLSFDGNFLSICQQVKELGGPAIFTVPVTGGVPKQVNKKVPSYPHGWSPDGKHLLFAASRDGEFEVYKISVNGGEEYSITDKPGMDDGPEYSPDGKYIYFSSNRTGSMCIWRMNPDGSGQERMTNGNFHDWFPHVSPDGKWVVFLSYSNDDVSSSGHPPNKQVYIRLIPASGGQPRIITYLYGGQGTINSPCWSPDSKKIAFSSFTYE